MADPSKMDTSVLRDPPVPRAHPTLSNNSTEILSLFIAAILGFFLTDPERLGTLKK